MGYLFSEIFFWMINKLIIFVFILSLLVGLYSINSEYQRYKDDEKDRAELIDIIAENKARLEILEKEINERKQKRLKDLKRKRQNTRNNLQDIKLSLANLKIGPFGPIPGTDPYITKLKLEKIIIELELKIKWYDSQIMLIYNSIDPALVDLSDKIASDQKRLDKIDEEFAKDLTHKIIKSVKKQVSPALYILIGIIMIPVVLKVLFYYVIAPFAGKRPSIQLLPETSGETNTSKGNISFVSIDVRLNPNEQLVIRPEYIQSLPLHSKIETQWFINLSLPFSSISTGLILLSKITTKNSEPIIVSATKHPLMEIGVLEIPEGSAMVCHPRSLAGVVHEADKKINIKKHWRLFTLQSWLTLQLRYLIIHGPCKLIVNGCRGIRVETAQQARTINQSATLGFSANLNYSNTRCEPFVPYWMGKNDLLNDLFQGEHGVYVYEEMPDQHRKSGITGRGLEGFADTVLKVFGL